MKTFGFAALAVCAALAAFLLLNPTVPNRAETLATPERPLVFVPGLLGSMLCRPGAGDETVTAWGTVEAMERFPTLAVASDDGIAPCGLIREISYLGIFTQAVYGPFIDRLTAAGYVVDKTLFVFDYDWRQSVFTNAERLAAFVDEKLPDGKFDIVAHSMGGLVARTYVLEQGGAERVARLVSAGSPWRGSVQVFQLLQGGWGLGNLFLGGLDTFRRTVISFPSTFEMIPQYDGCCGPDGGGFYVTSAEAWAALNWPGIDRDRLPDFAEVGNRQARLRDIVSTPLPADIEEALVIGVDQRTPEQFELLVGDGEAQLNVRTSWEGDGTVTRGSATLAGRVVYPTSFATHDAILNDGLVQNFVVTALRRGPQAAAAAVPVRERDLIATAVGQFVQLVGVAVVTDQPVHRTGTTAKAIVHLRLDVQEPVAAEAITLTARRPDGTAVTVTLRPDPEASDPTNPFEQSFSAMIETGSVPGELTLTVTIDGPKPRTVTRVVPVVAR